MIEINGIIFSKTMQRKFKVYSTKPESPVIKEKMFDDSYFISLFTAKLKKAQSEYPLRSIIP